MSVDRPAARRLLSLPPLLLLPLLLLLALSGVAGAQASGGEATRAARAHNAAAREHFKRGEYAKAAGRYEQAFKARPLPVFLYNIAQSLKRLGDLLQKKRALVYYDRYLALVAPGAPGRAAAAAQREALAKTIARREREAKAARERSVVPATPHASPPLASPPQPSQPSLRLQQPTQPRPRRPVARPFYKRWWFWTIVGAVVAGGAVTAGVIAGQSGSASGPPIYDWSSFR